jgi:hypothetical protein
MLMFTGTHEDDEDEDEDDDDEDDDDEVDDEDKQAILCVEFDVGKCVISFESTLK